MNNHVLILLLCTDIYPVTTYFIIYMPACLPLILCCKLIVQNLIVTSGFLAAIVTVGFFSLSDVLDFKFSIGTGSFM